MLRKTLVLLALVAAVIPASAQAKFLQFGMNEEEVKAVVKDYLLKNPEIVKEAMDNYAAKEAEMKKQAAIAKLKTHRAALERDPKTPVLGNPDGDITIVEFFDYNCGYCKLMFPKVWEYVQNDGNIRWVLKDMPSLGETSTSAAKAGLAAEKQGKYFEMHQAMITHKGSLTEEDIVAYAKQVGLDMKKFEADRKDKALDGILRANRTLAGKFEFFGIPDFIIGDFISHGAMMGDELDTNVTAIREKAAK
ncbi:MAG: thioredoxin domain-containing protein [Alphaproteobacteria bacterium]|nr:thioredoxin domain-containing protein [Alphaproteobacteria bacterium]MBO4643386.1 thioredoxin domain-containing protein [Alphaproteobacteria bacterium]